jgi:hypothetical protein
MAGKLEGKIALETRGSSGIVCSGSAVYQGGRLRIGHGATPGKT